MSFKPKITALVQTTYLREEIHAIFWKGFPRVFGFHFAELLETISVSVYQLSRGAKKCPRISMSLDSESLSFSAPILSNLYGFGVFFFLNALLNFSVLLFL